MEFDEETALNYLLKYELIKRDAEDENRFCIYPLDEAIARLHAGRYAQIVQKLKFFFWLIDWTSKWSTQKLT